MFSFSLHPPTHPLVFFYLLQLSMLVYSEWISVSAISQQYHGAITVPFLFGLLSFFSFTKSTYGHSYRDSRASLRYFFFQLIESTTQLDNGTGPTSSVKIYIPVSPMNNFTILLDYLRFFLLIKKSNLLVLLDKQCFLFSIKT